MNETGDYLRWITPKLGDPTYSLLKAHLLFEELLHAYLRKVLPHASALQGARLTFVQLLALARASSTHLQPDYWGWKAIGDLNKLRNMLSHEAHPKDLPERMQAYTKYVSEHLHSSWPEPAFRIGVGESPPAGVPLYTPADFATIMLYYRTAWALGFEMSGLDRQGDLQAERRTGDANEGAR
jgi:hypothetical protein